MAEIIMTDLQGNKQTISFPEKFNIEVGEYKTTDVISRETFIRKIQDLVSFSNFLNEKTVFKE
jgi:hypothetical protein